jgi:hypothetical protein
MLCTSDLPHQRNNNPMIHDSSALAADASNDGTMLGRDVVERDRARLDDIRLESARPLTPRMLKEFLRHKSYT